MEFEQFFDEHGEQILRPDVWGMHSHFTVEEFYQMIKTRLVQELVNDGRLLEKF